MVCTVFRMFVLALLVCVALATPAQADRFVLTYNGYGLGFVPIGSVTVDADVSEDSYDAAATLESGGLLRLFEPTNLSASASGAIADGGVFWRRYNLDHRYSGKRRVIDMHRGDDGGVVASIEPTYRVWGDPPASDEERRGARDPLSTMIAMAIDVGRTRTCDGSYPVFDGRFHYLLRIAEGDPERYVGGGYNGEALECSLAYIAVSGFEARDSGRRRIPEGGIVFALMPDSNFAPPVRISTPLSAGAATIRLASFRRARVDVEYNTQPNP
jgi:hypothetical protein